MQVSYINSSNNYINPLSAPHKVQVPVPPTRSVASTAREDKLQQLQELGLCDKNYDLDSSIVTDARFNKLSAPWITRYAIERLNAKLSFGFGREMSVGQLFSKLYQFAQQKGIPFEAIQIVGSHPISSVDLTWVRGLFLDAALIHQSAEEIYSTTLEENLKKPAHDVDYNLSTSIDANWEQVQDLNDFFLAELATLIPVYDGLSMEERAYELQDSGLLGKLWENNQAEKGFVLVAVNATSEGQIDTDFSTGNDFSYTLFSGTNFKVCIVPGSIHLLEDGTIDMLKLEVYVESRGCNVLKALFDRGYNLIADHPASIFNEKAFAAFLKEIARGSQCCDSQLFQKVIQAIILGPSSPHTLGFRTNKELVKVTNEMKSPNSEEVNGMLTALALMLELGMMQKQEHQSSAILRRQLCKMWDIMNPSPSVVAKLRSIYRIPARFLTIPWLLGGLMRLGQTNSTDSRISLTTFEGDVALRFKLQNVPEGFAQFKLNATEMVAALGVSLLYYVPIPALDLLLKGGLDLLDLEASPVVQKSLLALEKNKHIWNGFVKEQVEEFLLAEHPYYHFAGTALLYAAWKANSESSIASYLLTVAVPILFSSGHSKLCQLATNLHAELEYSFKEPTLSALQSVEVEKENEEKENPLVVLVKNNEISEEKVRNQIAVIFVKGRIRRAEFVSHLELFYILPEEWKALRIDLAKTLLKQLSACNYKIPSKEKQRAIEAFILLLPQSEETSFAILSLKRTPELKRLFVQHLDTIMTPITEYNAQVVQFLTDLQPFMASEKRSFYAHQLLKNPEICSRGILCKWVVFLPADQLSKEERTEVVSHVEKMPDAVGFSAALIETLQEPQEDEVSDISVERSHWADLEPATTDEESIMFWGIAQNTLSETLTQKQFWRDFLKLRGKLLPEHVALLDSTYLESFFTRASKWMKSLILQKVAKWENLSKEIHEHLEAADPLAAQDIVGDNSFALRRLYNLCKRKNSTLDIKIWEAVLQRLANQEQSDHWSKLTYNLWKQSLGKFSDTLKKYPESFYLILRCAMKFDDQAFLKESYSQLSQIVPLLPSQVDLYQNYIIYCMQKNIASKKNYHKLIASYKQLALTPEKTHLLVQNGAAKLLTQMEQMERRDICIALFEQLLAASADAKGCFDFNDSRNIKLFQVFAPHIAYWSPADFSVAGREKLFAFVFNSLEANQGMTWNAHFTTPKDVVGLLKWLHEVKSFNLKCQKTLKNVTVLYWNCLTFSKSLEVLQDVAIECAKVKLSSRIATLATEVGQTLIDNYVDIYVNPIGLIELLQHSSASIWFSISFQSLLGKTLLCYNAYIKTQSDCDIPLSDRLREDFEEMGLSTGAITALLPAFKQALDKNIAVIKKRLPWVMNRVNDKPAVMTEIRSIAAMEVSSEERSTKIVQKLKEQLVLESCEIHKLFLDHHQSFEDLQKWLDLLTDSIWELFMVYGNAELFLSEAKNALQRYCTISEGVKDIDRYTVLTLRFQSKFITKVDTFKTTSLNHKKAFCTLWYSLLKEFAEHIIQLRHANTQRMQVNITGLLKQFEGMIGFSKEDPALFAAMKEQFMALHNKVKADSKLAGFAELPTIAQLLQ